MSAVAMSSSAPGKSRAFHGGRFAVVGLGTVVVAGVVVRMRTTLASPRSR